jgi:drug/metabolite transporter (DMT)-like permease
MSKRLITILETLFAVIIWGCTFVATKVALKEVKPETVIALRFAMGVIVLAAGVQLRKQWQPMTRRDLLTLAGLGFLGITFHQWLQSTGLVTSAASTTAWIVATSPIFIVILGWLVLREKISWLQIGGTVLAFFGVLLVVTRGNLALSNIGRIGTVGDLLILISAVNWAVFSVLSRGMLKRLPSALMMFYVMLFGWIFSTVTFFIRTGTGDILNLTSNGWMAVVFLGILGSGLAYIAWYDALQNLKANEAGVFLNIEPLVTMIVAFFILGEPVTWASLLGGAVIIFGVWLVNHRPVKA